MTTFPLLVTADPHAVPERYWTVDATDVDDMGEAYGTQVCNVCRQPIADHVWFLLASESTVVDCSEVRL
jgi:hypothetical protein